MSDDQAVPRGRVIADGRTVLRGRVIGEGGTEIVDGAVEFGDGVITWVGPAADYRRREALPARSGDLILPGLIDLHCHGGSGFGFPNADATGALTAADHHRGHGTTGLLGSLVSAPEDVLVRQAGVLSGLVEDGALLGVHLEGPFLSVARCGAQDPAAIVPGDPGLFERVCEAARGTVRSMTIAPETARFPALLAAMRRHGVVPSLGHTDADAATTAAAVADAQGGPVTATHLFNAMPPMHHRAPGPAGACLAAAGRGDLILELIADGVHLAPETVAMVFDTVGPDHVALVSDAMAAAGMRDGDYRLGALDVRVHQGVARLATADGAPGAIAGGTFRLLDVLRHTVFHAAVPLGDAVTAATRTPARVLGLAGERGGLTPGHRADILVTDEMLRPRRVLVAGEEGN
ncbi:N-acetylglucosamine-6-phosphate deacetylase [Nocardia thailandica]|uniref:N-acetylglucosamine-6-phosphate deacetylase n=1 Tax=Nocardia thailandica TaxID=257275 RepID=UPI000301FD82|nr:amidohydrolase family protein [Nocardia thailandica]